MPLHLPMTTEDLILSGYISNLSDFDPESQYLDIIIISGDAYVDHPSFGAALIGRWLENLGYSVGIIAQPDWKNTSSVKALGKPGLFAAVSSGNLDSMLHHYTAAGKLRHDDPYTPGGKHGLRPNRAVIAYTSLVKSAWKDICVVIGGTESTCRRIAHYDYWSDSVRGSVLPDSKADILVYGNAESQLSEIAAIARRCGGDKRFIVKECSDMPGICIMETGPGAGDLLPSLEDCRNSNADFIKAFNLFYANQNPWTGKTLWQKHDHRFLRHNRPALPLSEETLDKIYSLPFTRRAHPSYKEKIPALETVKWSVQTHRGCFGGCNFCSIYITQGGTIQSRSPESVISEVKDLANSADFHGTVTDLGGPSANMYGLYCKIDGKKNGCRRTSCLTPEICSHLYCDHSHMVKLYQSVEKISKVKHVFIGSGLRYDLALEDEKYMEVLCQNHVSGILKIAPEHADDKVLRLMNKPSNSKFRRFLKIFKKYKKKEQFLVPYIMSSHPGSDYAAMQKTSDFLRSEGLTSEQAQDFIPLPLTVSSVMFHTGINPLTGESVFVEKTPKGKLQQRYLLVPEKNHGKKVRPSGRHRTR